MRDKRYQFYKALKEHNLAPLFVAAWYGLPWCTYYLLSRCDVDVNEVCNGTTPLNLAIECRNVTVAKLLLTHPVIKLLSRQKNTPHGPLVAALFINDANLFALMLRFPIADINEKDIYGRSCYIYACSCGNYKALEKLFSSSLKAHVQTDLYCDGSQLTASHYACVSGSVSVVEFLIRRGIFQSNAMSASGQTPLELAC